MTVTGPEPLGRSRLLRAVWRAAGGHPLWAVGGAVRDRLLGLPWRDLDLVAAGTLEETAGLARQIAELLGGRPHALGRPPRAVWRIEGGRYKAEIWPLGELTPEEDALRRDFTVNAVLWALPAGPFLDPAGGLADLRARRLRAVSRENLETDPVRLLRAPRLAASLPGFRIEARTAAWIRALAPRLRDAPRERIGQELRLLLDGRGAPRAWRFAVAHGLLRNAAPDPDGIARGALRRGAAVLQRLGDRGRHPLPVALGTGGAAARLGLLVSAWGVPSDGILSAYAWERELRQTALRAAALWPEAAAACRESWRDRRRVIHRAGRATPAVLALAAAFEPGDPAAWRRFWRLWLKRGKELTDPVPPLDPATVGSLLGLEPGPELGEALRSLVAAWVEGRATTPGAARRFLRTRTGRSPSHDG